MSSGEDLILPEGQVGEEAAEMLQDFLRPGHRQDETLVDLDEGDLADEEERKALPWWKRPSPYWRVHLPYRQPEIAPTYEFLVPALA